MTPQERSDQPVRVRFAPSPTGYLHIGGARTALFNWLYARQKGGVFVLRIEDTDRERSTPEAVRAIFDGLRYLGLDWDEGPDVGGPHGPYFQSEREGRHREFVLRLLDAGAAYPCFCSKERLDELRESQRAAKGRIGYDRLCASIPREEAQRRIDAGEPAVVRFKVPPGRTEFDDLIRGTVSVDHQDVDDMVIARADGSPVYNLAVVADDHDMEITHVIRGEDHLTNTTKQILLLEALGLAVPRYAHIPLILAPGGGKLSKRHGAVSVTEYRDLGYLPEAMINFLVRMGWSYDDKQEIFTLDELIEKFSLSSVSKSGAMYDSKKLEHIGAHWMREKPGDEAFELARPFLVATPWIREEHLDPRSPERLKVEAILSLEKERISRFGELESRIGYYFDDPTELDKGALKALRKAEGAEGLVADYAAALERDFPEGWGPLDEELLERHATAFLEARGESLGTLAQPVRALVTGRAATPSLFAVLAVVGRAATLRRLARAPEWFAKARE